MDEESWIEYMVILIMVAVLGFTLGWAIDLLVDYLIPILAHYLKITTQLCTGESGAIYCWRFTL